MVLYFEGGSGFRQRILLSLLSGKTVCFRSIRSNEENPGIADFEVKFLKLIELLTNGTLVDISYTGTEVSFKPGTIHGGELSFDCGSSRSIVYFLEGLLVLAPFSKFAFKVTLDGITADDVDQTIDGVKNMNCRILKLFGAEEGLDFKIIRRGARPLGGGRVSFTCPVVAQLKPVNMVDVGRVKKIRGIAATTRVSPQFATRMIEAARSQLNPFIPDIYIYADVFKGEDAGRSSGYSLYLQAESTTGALVSADGVGLAEQPVESLAHQVARDLILEIKNGGIVDKSHQWMLLMFMALCPEDLSKVTLGPLAPNIETLQKDLRDFLGVSFKTRPSAADGSVTVSCIGSGYCNLNRRLQ